MQFLPVRFFRGAILFILTFLFTISTTASPRINYSDLIINSIENPAHVKLAKQHALAQNMPISVLLPGNIKIDVLGLEDGKVVYGVINNFAHPSRGAKTLFYDELIASYDISKGHIYYGNGVLVDNTNGMFDPKISDRGNGPFLLIPDSGQDRIVMVDAQTGDIVDPFFFPAGTANFSTPKIALLTPRATFLVSDQLTDGVWEYDTTGTSLGIFAPVGGVNTSILDNIRGIMFRPNGNLLVTVGGGGNINTVQQFDTAGVSLGTFMSGVTTSPFNLAYRSNDILVSTGSGTSRVHKFDFNGTFITSFPGAGSYGTMQQIYVENDNSFVVCCLTGTHAGLVKFDSAGNHLNVLTGISTNYGVYRLGNGNYLATNSSGLHEIDDTTGALIRTIMPMFGQYISLYDPSTLVGVGNQTSQVADAYKLYNNYPNPFNPSTNIKYAIPSKGIVTLKVYNSLGKEVAKLIDQFHTPGEYEYTFDASGLSSGIYYYTISSGNFTETKKMVLLK